MAALSVERARLGKNTVRLWRLASASNVARSSRLAATPPDTRIDRTLFCWAAAMVRFTRSSTTARWKLATKSSVAARESLLARVNFRLQLGMTLQVVQHRRLDAAETEIVGIAFHLRFPETNRARIAVQRELIHHRAAGIAESEQARDFVVGFAGCVVARATEAFVGKMRGAVVRF